MTEDEGVFGEGVIVYCSSHGRPHFTGWCTVSPRNKTRLESTNIDVAYAECRKCGYWLYDDRANTREAQARVDAKQRSAALGIPDEAQAK